MGTQSILVIDDSVDIHSLITARLMHEGVNLLQAFDATEGVEIARKQRPDLVLLDLDLSGTSGLDVCRMLKSDIDTLHIPVIFLTGETSTAVKEQAFDLGAVDYVTKPFDGVELRARVRAALRSKHYHDLLITRANLDGLTGLWNRAYFDLRLNDELATAAREKHGVTLLMLDVDHFKRINDTWGHPCGDAALRQIAGILETSIRPSDALCRYGGEEFGVILPRTSLEDGARLADEIRSRVQSAPVVNHGRHVEMTISIGLACSDGEGGQSLSPREIVEKADTALYTAKRDGRNRVCLAA